MSRLLHSSIEFLREYFLVNEIIFCAFWTDGLFAQYREPLFSIILLSHSLSVRAVSSKTNFCKRLLFLFFPSGQGYGSPFLASYRCISGNNLGTDMLAQQARSAASCMVILAHNRRNGRHFPLFPYLLIYRNEEAAGSNPARST